VVQTTLVQSYSTVSFSHSFFKRMSVTGHNPSTPVETPGLYLLTADERALYDEWIRISEDESVPKDTRASFKHAAAKKLKNVIKKRMPAAEKEAMAANKQAKKQAVMDHKQQQIDYAVSLFNATKRSDYDSLKAEAANPSTSASRREKCDSMMYTMVRYAISKQADKDLTPTEFAAVKAERQKVSKINREIRKKRRQDGDAVEISIKEKENTKRNEQAGYKRKRALEDELQALQEDGE
jgi:hypothetical protein